MYLVEICGLHLGLGWRRHVFGAWYEGNDNDVATHQPNYEGHENLSCLISNLRPRVGINMSKGILKLSHGGEETSSKVMPPFQ